MSRRFASRNPFASANSARRPGLERGIWPSARICAIRLSLCCSTVSAPSDRSKSALANSNSASSASCDSLRRFRQPAMCKRFASIYSSPRPSLLRGRRPNARISAIRLSMRSATERSWMAIRMSTAKCLLQAPATRHRSCSHGREITHTQTHRHRHRHRHKLNSTASSTRLNQFGYSVCFLSTLLIPRVRSAQAWLQNTLAWVRRLRPPGHF